MGITERTGEALIQQSRAGDHALEQKKKGDAESRRRQQSIGAKATSVERIAS
jgi:hypothetical protein